MFTVKYVKHKDDAKSNSIGHFNFVEVEVKAVNGDNWLSVELSCTPVHPDIQKVCEFVIISAKDSKHAHKIAESIENDLYEHGKVDLTQDFEMLSFDLSIDDIPY